MSNGCDVIGLPLTITTAISLSVGSAIWSRTLPLAAVLPWATTGASATGALTATATSASGAPVDRAGGRQLGHRVIRGRPGLVEIGEPRVALGVGRLDDHGDPLVGAVADERDRDAGRGVLEVVVRDPHGERARAIVRLGAR